MNFFEQVTIGIPVYNEDNFIRDTLLSAVKQNCNIIISDNGSTDLTQSICEEFQNQYPYVLYIRQEKNLGTWLNFKYVLEQAKTPYFLWLGGHDLISEQYVADALLVLKDSAETVAVYGELKRIEMRNKVAMSPTALKKPSANFLKKLASSDPLDRMYHMVVNCPHCVIIHALFKTAALKNICQNLEPHLGMDLHILARLSKEGRFIQLSGISYSYRDFTTDQVSQNIDPVERWIKTLNPPDAAYRISGYGYFRRGIYSAFRSTPYGAGYFQKLKKSYLRRRLKKFIEQNFGPFTYP